MKIKGFFTNGKLNKQGGLKVQIFDLEILRIMTLIYNLRIKNMMIVRKMLSMETSTFHMSLFSKES